MAAFAEPSLGIENGPMRLWSVHPGYLDSRGLVGLWRESLLAQAVLKGETKGYRRHPQLVRFRTRTSPVAFIADYLRAVHAESVVRGYRFDTGKIARVSTGEQIDVSRGQVEFEWRHLTSKLQARSPEWLERHTAVSTPRVHPLFRVVPGDVADWERGTAVASERHPSRNAGSACRSVVAE